MKRSYFLLVVVVMLLLVGGVAGYAIGFSYERVVLMEKLNAIHPIRDKNPTYAFIDPLLAYVVPSADQYDELAALKKKLTSLIDIEKHNRTIEDASLFFYDLNRGRWIGVNENETYNPASMLKVVIMVSYLKDTETNSGVLGKKLTYTAALDELLKKDPFNSASSLQVSKSYAVEDLIDKMIIDSDNGAEFLLLDNIDTDSLNYIYNALNITSPEKAEGDFVISPRTYSLFFRILYSSTYLSRDMSEKALSILSKTTFSDGIVAGLPAGLVASHKFGEYVSSDAGKIKNIELHDCGIVYTKNNPYFLCVMTRGDDVSRLSGVIKNISTTVYKNYSAD